MTIPMSQPNTSDSSPSDGCGTAIAIVLAIAICYDWQSTLGLIAIIVVIALVAAIVNDRIKQGRQAKADQAKEDYVYLMRCYENDPDNVNLRHRVVEAANNYALLAKSADPNSNISIEKIHEKIHAIERQHATLYIEEKSSLSLNWIDAIKKAMKPEFVSIERCIHLDTCIGRLCDLREELRSLVSEGVVTEKEYIKIFYAIVCNETVYAKLYRLQKLYDDGEVARCDFYKFMAVVFKKLHIPMSGTNDKLREIFRRRSREEIEER